MNLQMITIGNIQSNIIYVGLSPYEQIIFLAFVCVQSVDSARERYYCARGPKMVEELFQCMCPVINFSWYKSVPSWNTVSSSHNTLMAQPRFLSPQTVHMPNMDNVSKDQVSGDSLGGYTIR